MITHSPPNNTWVGYFSSILRSQNSRFQFSFSPGVCSSLGIGTRVVVLLPALLLPVLLRLGAEQGHGHHPGHRSLFNVISTPGAARSWWSSPHTCSSIPASWWRWGRRRWRRRRWRRWIGGKEGRETGVDFVLLLGSPYWASPPSTQERVYSSLQGGLRLNEVSLPCKAQIQNII